MILKNIRNIFKHFPLRSESGIKELWKRLRKDDPVMLKTFEDFISNISGELKRSKSDFVILENALQK